MRIQPSTARNRAGTVAVLLCFLLVPLLGLLALSVDYGFLLYVDCNLQRVADQAALAAVRELEPESDGYQDLAKVRQVVREYVELNAGEGFVVRDQDIEIGRYDPATVYNSFTILNSGIFDTVRITVRRSDLSNTSVTLYFARIFGNDKANVNASATAVLQKARYLEPGSDILPIAVEKDIWDSQTQFETWSVYGDGRIENAQGDTIPGNWGTLDIGVASNSTNALVDQINNGLRQEDLDALHRSGSISDSDHIDSDRSMWLNGDTGFSSGIRESIQASHGKKKLVPIFDHSHGHGGGMDYRIVGWGVIEIVDSAWQGSKNSRVEIRKSYTYDSDLRPHPDLSETTEIIHAAYTSPVLVQ